MDGGTSLSRVASDAWGTWDRFLAGHPDSGYHQSSWWAVAHCRAGENAFGVMIRRGGIVRGGAVVLRAPLDEQHACYQIGDGPVLPTDPILAEELLGTLLATLQGRRAREPVVITHLRLEPRWAELPDQLRSLGPLVVGPSREITTIDLAAAETGILAQMSRAARANIALARQLGIRIVEDGGPRGIDDLQRMAGRSVPEEIGAMGRGGIFFAEDRGERLAAAAMVLFGARATLLVAAPGSQHPDAPAPAFLQFEMMRRAKARHCLEYDLGPLGTEGTGFGGTARPRVGTIDVVFEPIGYERFASAPEGIIAPEAR